MRTIRVVSRRSELAMKQTQDVIELLAAVRPEWRFQVIPVVTAGDRIQDVPLSKVGGKGLFVSEVEQALHSGDGDMTVHSLKDVPAEVMPGLTLAGFPKRAEARDALISRTGQGLMDLPKGARIGTSSLRRGAQLLAARPDFEVISIRGNIDTRLRKLETADLHAVVLAAAGLARLGWLDRVTELLSADVCLPAVGQGILGIECRSDDRDLVFALAAITDPATRTAAGAERALLKRLDGSCQVPIASYAEVLSTHQVSVTGLVASLDGQSVLRATATGADGPSVGVRVAEELVAAGALRVIAAATGADAAL